MRQMNKCLQWLLFCLTCAFLSIASACSGPRFLEPEDRFPSWAPDNMRMVFVCTRPQMSKIDWSHDYQGPYSGSDSLTLLEICISNVDGSNRRQLTDNLMGDFSPAWSPDGTRIAFTSERDSSEQDIYVIHSDGTGVVNLTNHAGYNTSPRWSPNGQTIAFISKRDGRSTNLYIMDADGSNVTRLTEIGNVWDFDWSPDGESIVFVTISWGSDSTSDRGVYIVTIGDGTVIQLLNNLTSVPQSVWLPDGQHIAFMSKREGKYQIYTLDVQTRKETKVLEGFNPNVMPSWSPDGKLLAYLSGGYAEPNQINLLDIETKTVATFSEFRAPLIMSLVWSPNSQYLAYGRVEDWNDDGFGEIKLWVLRVEDGAEWAVSSMMEKN